MAMIHAEDAVDFSTWVLNKVGVRKNEARICAKVLIEADILGMTTHGLSRLKYYIDRMDDGLINAKEKMEVLRDNKTIAIVDGHNAMGQVVAHKSMKLAIKKAKKFGMGCVAVKNSSHYGIAGYYSRMCAEKNLVGLSFTNARPAVAPYDGIEPKMGTNPYAIAFPSDEPYPFSIDCATSIWQRGNLEVMAREQGGEVPECAIASNKDRVTFRQALEMLTKGTAALKTIGGHKGYGLSVVIELFCSSFQSGAFLTGLAGYYEGGEKKPYDIGHFFMCIDPELFVDLGEFKKNVGDVMRELKSTKGIYNREVFVPGEKEYLYSKKVNEKGIEVSEELMKELDDMGWETWKKDYTTRSLK